MADKEAMEVDACALGKALEAVALLIVETSLCCTAMIARLAQR